MYIEARVTQRGRVTPAFQIDECFLEEVSGITCSLSGPGYIQTHVNGKTIYLHRYIWLLHTGDWPEGEIDHINRDRLDNRVENLRDVSRSENERNKAPFCKVGKKMPNKSGLPAGVSFNRKCKTRPYAAQVKVGGKNKYLGMFATPEEASAAYQAAVAVLKEQANA